MRMAARMAVAEIQKNPSVCLITRPSYQTEAR